MTIWGDIAARTARAARYRTQRNRRPGSGREPAEAEAARPLELELEAATGADGGIARRTWAGRDDESWWRHSVAARWRPQESDGTRAGSGLEYGPISEGQQLLDPPADGRGPGPSGPAPAM